MKHTLEYDPHSLKIRIEAYIKKLDAQIIKVSSDLKSSVKTQCLSQVPDVSAELWTLIAVRAELNLILENVKEESE